MPPLDWLAVRQINARYLYAVGADRIADLHQGGVTVTAIAQQVDRSK